MTEDDSNDEKSGTEVGNCVKGSRIRKAVPPPEDEFLLTDMVKQTIVYVKCCADWLVCLGVVLFIAFV